ncbi:ABC transporter permease [Dongia rigui]|uniref:ABC transporter permease n=1 Tax=Dongia rigui TaxID=940149 RepID=A0ABU5DX02_9PROT|nr:ABC transporter permease [Dongia rigui]MDY0871753.1 ABC transporter permease [Dongia rigui]
MLRYLIQRVLVMVPTLLVISMLVFAIIQAPPGDFLETMMAEMQSRGENMDQDKMDFLRKTYGLDEPTYVQYVHWMFGRWEGFEHKSGGLLFGDLGYSFEHNLPVSEVVGDRLMLTVVVSLASILFVWIVSFPIAVYSATHQYSIFDYVFTFLGYIGLATPSFLIALVLLYFANIYFGTSIGGMMDAAYVGQPWSLAKVMSVLEHMWIAVLVIGLPGTAGMIRRLRANLLDELNKQYVTTGRAKGLPPLKLLLRYPLRISLNPFIADIGSLLPELISGSVIVSVVMSLPITGPMLLSALRSQDMYLAGSFLMFMAFLTVIGIFVSDVLLALLDPRIRLGAGAEK